MANEKEAKILNYKIRVSHKGKNIRYRVVPRSSLVHYYGTEAGVIDNHYVLFYIGEKINDIFGVENEEDLAKVKQRLREATERLLEKIVKKERNPPTSMFNYIW
ncbi:MAG: hypothetical protein NTW17_01000 [Candidatus Pacearchaeota archaeon]|nr:hypothetical protein [Candidatus Pacearchaeota archaeon]